MGRTPMTDEEKVKRGTLDKRYSDEARGKATMNKVLAFPVLREIPDPTFPLREKGEKVFKFWCHKLLDAGLLTQITAGDVETFALNEDKIQGRIDVGKELSDRTLEVRRICLQKLEALNVDTTIHAGAKNKSAFAKNGFPNRLLASAEHTAKRTG